MQTPEPPSSNATSSAHAMPQVPGYRVERVLGRGGMAVVYLAVQESLDRQVAIKVMMPAGGLDEAQSLRFELEARTIAKLEHPGIVGIHEVGRTGDGQLYYVMPYLANGDLSERDYRDDEDGLIALLRTLLDALGYAHARGIVHRDVKAENVLFNNADQPQLADFGIALSQKGSSSPRVTTDGLALGSGGHMPPEQARGAVVDGRADLYSLGVLTYELLTGELPYHAEDALGLAVMHASDPIPRLPGDKAHWQEFIDQAMAKSPERRFRNAQAMLRALDRVHERLHPRGGIVGWLVHPAWRRPGVQVALGALVAVCVAVALWPRGDTASGPSATPVVVAAPATPAPALDADARAAIESRLADAQAQLVAGALLVPAGANAAESYLDVLKADPGNSDARTGLESVLAALAATVVDAAQSDGPDATQERYRQTALFADMAQLRDSSAFGTLRVSTLEAALAATQARIAAYDAAGANAWWPLLEELSPDASLLASLRERIAALPTAGATVRDDAGPELAFVPAEGSAPPFALMRDEVSRSDYARFADATNRAAVRCRNRLSPLQLFDKRDWRDPDFKQGGNEPVVCVSVDDAQAYAAWLSRATGQRYRLPTTGEWRRAAGGGAVGCASGNVHDRSAASRGSRHACSDGHANTAPARRYPANALGIHDVLGNVSEWTLNCGSADNAIARTLEADACPRRAAIGPSWRDGPGVSAASVQMLPPERGYDDVGFRLLREM